MLSFNPSLMQVLICLEDDLKREHYHLKISPDGGRLAELIIEFPIIVAVMM